ncbi:hypothetical protein [Streptomyces acidicola]|uniref:Uncharacterized protein n=1 Tax=Streptomyces acidicola TaxID=2596892 RepID=A0A5N8WJB5_9ACTN|nr:hypothetical protein [Streptomyces acidicola]MPY47063.1 hypothetical protein [Streptomyces acidicola]MPY47202.1 hypothetical protein [Streptomyces acidicola]
MPLFSQNRPPKIVRQSPVKSDTLDVTVSTIRIARGNYNTVIFDNHADKRHAGFFLGGYAIDHSSQRAETREAAMDQHREALYAARTEEPFPPRGGHDESCAYISGMTTRCTCSTEGGVR